MERKDVSREVTEMAAVILRDILNSVREQIFQGPYAIEMDRKTALSRLASMGGVQRLQLASQMGVDEYINQAQALSPTE